MPKTIDPLRELRLVPPALEAELPEHITITNARAAVRALVRKTNGIAEAVASYPWLSDVRLVDRAGTVGSDFAGALESLRQAVLALDLAIDARLLDQRKTAGERMSRAMARKREAHLAGELIHE